MCKETDTLIGLAQGGGIIPVMGIKGRLNYLIQFKFISLPKGFHSVSTTPSFTRLFCQVPLRWVYLASLAHLKPRSINAVFGNKWLRFAARKTTLNES